MLTKRKPPEIRLRAAFFFNASNLPADPTAIPSDQESKLVPNRRGHSYVPNALGPRTGHTGHTHSNHQGDKIDNRSIELAEEGVERLQVAR